ncbi:lysine 2,3-aminomutase [Cellulosilyticum sp. I15G10I2]|uniref:lysine 2,3-aminomutase n=1 Tax=Cellulosilyticum sp. I15G10I2 TaxID=1892843 RepID=UPI000A8896CF|nr:lysine 2,3-aminomutase [Cellulosilyticum sp. I15G10I2]
MLQSMQSIQFLYSNQKGEENSYKLHQSWQDWKWQLANTIKTVEEIEKILHTTFDEKKKKALQMTLDRFPMAITPYYLSLVDASDYENDPVFKQAFPDVRELDIASADMLDPLAEDHDSPVDGITHRYPDRVLFHVSNSCAMYCRHCTRKRKVGDKDFIPSKDKIMKGIEYIKVHKEVRDVLLSGGDPFMLPDDMLIDILDEISKIEHVEVMRIGTRTPVVLPYRITEELATKLSKYDNLWINTHFNHPKELTKEARVAVNRLVKAGIPMGNQSVLLADVNDCPRIMKKLVQKLVQFRVRPYYIYQCDLSEGLEHFRTCIGKGIEIMESLRGHTSGFAIPTYVVDAPGGGGKIPVMPNYLISWSTNKVILRNYEGVITTYQEPSKYEHTKCDLKCNNCNLHLKLDKSDNNEVIGIEKLLCDYDETITLKPAE